MYTLLRIICRICEYAGVKTPLRTIAAVHYNAMFISKKEVIVQETLPLLVYQLSVAMSQQLPRQLFTSYKLACKILEFVWELSE
jgi:hypothetical protein